MKNGGFSDGKVKCSEKGSRKSDEAAVTST